MKQQSLASQNVFEKYGRKFRRELSLDETEKIGPWSLVCAGGSGASAMRSRQRAAAGGSVDHAADVLRPAEVQPV